jgi:hypothetical protein
MVCSGDIDLSEKVQSGCEARCRPFSFNNRDRKKEIKRQNDIEMDLFHFTGAYHFTIICFLQLSLF